MCSTVREYGTYNMGTSVQWIRVGAIYIGALTDFLLLVPKWTVFKNSAQTDVQFSPKKM